LYLLGNDDDDDVEMNRPRKVARIQKAGLDESRFFSQILAFTAFDLFVGQNRKEKLNRKITSQKNDFMVHC